VQLFQPQKGYRAGLDAALLGGATGLSPGERALEAGCGVGAALLQAAWRAPGAELVGLERDEAAVSLAIRNIAANDMTGRVSVHPADIRTPFSKLDLKPFDLAFANPPFFDDPASLRAPSPEKSGAWMADGGLEVWCHFLSKAVREGGRIVMIHRADRLADILAHLAPKAGSFRIRPIQPFADSPAKRVLVQAVKTGKAPLVLLPPLVLREGEAHRPEAEALFRGETSLSWD
jgi:tRNA1(Val) A37 N6-methylase TrmN6